MKNKLFKIGLLSLLLPSILLVKNTNAITIKNYRRASVQYISFKTTSPNADITNLELIKKSNTPLRNVSIQPSNVFQVLTLDAQTDYTVNYKTNDKFDITIFFYTFYDSYRGLNGKTIIPIVQCPTVTSSKALIDNCDIEYHDMVNSPIDFTNLGTSGDYAIQNKVQGYYAVKVYGHFTEDGAGNILGLRGPLISAYNPTSQALPFDYSIGFSVLRAYTEVPDEDKAAEELNEMNEKDEQDRNNIESQQESNEGSAEDKKDEANTTGTTLMGAFSALISALGNVHSTNCKLPNMQVYTLQLKNMDLCTVNMPTGISALAGIAVSLLIVKLGISLVKRMLALYREIIG